MSSKKNLFVTLESYTFHSSYGSDDEWNAIPPLNEINYFRTWWSRCVLNRPFHRSSRQCKFWKPKPCLNWSYGKTQQLTSFLFLSTHFLKLCLDNLGLIFWALYLLPQLWHVRLGPHRHYNFEQFPFSIYDSLLTATVNSYCWTLIKA